MNRKQDCRHDYCDCPCHRGKLIDANGKKRVKHPPDKCPCSPCPRCKLRVKEKARQQHLSRCPENPQNDTRAIAREKAEEETKKIHRDTKTTRRSRPAQHRVDEEIQTELDTEIILRVPEDN